MHCTVNLGTYRPALFAYPGWTSEFNMSEAARLALVPSIGQSLSMRLPPNHSTPAINHATGINVTAVFNPAASDTAPRMEGEAASPSKCSAKAASAYPLLRCMGCTVLENNDHTGPR